MSEKYYLVKNYCQCCGRYDFTLIGKDDVGVKFLFEIDDKHKDASDWIDDILIPSHWIEDNKGNKVDKDKFIDLIKSKSNLDSRSFVEKLPRYWTDGRYDYYNNDWIEEWTSDQ